ncbi:MAG: MFS transporter, partial [Victivallales bacterium]|nr:MFS transporter [Victivallales bacterium]
MLSNRMTRKGMDFSILSAVLWSVFYAATTGPVLAGLFLVLKLNNFQIGLVNSMTMLVLPAQVIGAVVQQRYFPRKTFWFWMACSQYSCYMLIFVLMLLWGLIDHHYAVTIFIALFATAQMAAQLGASVWMSWMSDLVPARESNNFWNRRGGLAQVSMMVGAIGVGVMIDQLGRELLSTYVWMYIIGVTFGYLSLFSQSLVPEPAPGLRPSTQPIIVKMLLTWRNRRFRQLLAFFGLHSLANWLVAPFIFIYLQKTLNFSMTTVQLLVAASSTVSFFSAYAFRVVGGKYGRKPVAMMCAFLKGIEFIGWGSLIPGASWRWALPVFMLGGFVNMGLGNATMSLITSVERRKNQSFTIAMFFAVTGLLGFASAGVSGICLDALDGLSWVKSGPFSAFNLLSLVVALGYFSSTLLFLNFHEDGSVSTVRVVKILLSNNPFRSVYHAHVLSRPMPEMTRIE